jgi:hypothetical protein
MCFDKSLLVRIALFFVTPANLSSWLDSPRRPKGGCFY